jgi:hypothetical protein
MGKSISTSGKSFGSPMGTEPGGFGEGKSGIGAGGGIVCARAVWAMMVMERRVANWRRQKIREEAVISLWEIRERDRL